MIKFSKRLSFGLVRVASRSAKIGATGLAVYAAATFGETPSMSFLGVRVLKTADAGSVDWSADFPSCAECRVVATPHTSGQNSREFFFHAWVPRGTRPVGSLRLRTDPAKVRRILLSFTDIDLPKRGWVRAEARANGAADVDFRPSDGSVSFEIPFNPQGVSLPRDDLADISQDYTFIETPGVYIRISHATKARRRGAYATGSWPAREAKAALNLEFAAREAIQMLHLDVSVPAAGAGTIMLMNFDTNYPTLGPDTAHDDWPPHWHMHLFWDEAPKVRKVGHFYITPTGLLGAFMSDDFKAPGEPLRAKSWIAAGEPDETRGRDGQLLYSHTITREGYFRISAPTGSCLFRPNGKGFDAGVTLTCSGFKTVRIRADDQPDQGRLKLFINGKISKLYRYDPDTAALIER